MLTIEDDKFYECIVPCCIVHLEAGSYQMARFSTPESKLNESNMRILTSTPSPPPVSALEASATDHS